MSLGARLLAVCESAGSAPAIKAEDQTVGYDELCDRVGRLAAALRRQGVEPGDTVALLLERGVDFIVCWLAVIWAGAVAMPLDPQDPVERNRALFEIGAVRSVLTHSSHGSVIPRQTGLQTDFQVIEVDTRRRELMAPEPAAPEAGLSPDAPAAVCSTSGSTTVPKAVLVPHEAILAGADWAAKALHAGPADGHILKTAVNFTSVLRQVAWPLLTGGWTCVLPPRHTKDLAALLRVMHDGGVTISSFFPSTVHTMINVGLPFDPGLRHILMGGEPLPGELLRRLAGQTEAQVRNLYGMTECNLALCYTCPAEPDFEFAPIGEPVDGVTATLTEVEAEPDAEAGAETAQDVRQLTVSGPHVALGYLGVPELTAGRFSRTATGERAFATHDEMIWTPAGLHFAGRSDDRVKVRGYSVELAAVESAFRKLDGVDTCVVLVRSVTTGDQRLEAFVRLHDQAVAAGLRDRVGDLLPSYMVPGAIHIVEDFPSLPNGKIDRRALLASTAVATAAAPETATPAAPEAAARAESSGPLADSLALFGSMLGTPVTPDADFFALGGHSLLMLELLAQVKERHGRQIEVADLLADPTPRRLAALLAAD